MNKPRNGQAWQALGRPGDHGSLRNAFSILIKRALHTHNCMTRSSQSLLLPLPNFGSIIQQEPTLRLVLWLRGGMQILVKTLTGQTTSQRTLEVKTITLNLKASDTVLRLKVMIEKMEDIMPKKQHLVFMEESLVNNRAISDHNIQKGGVLPLQIEWSMQI
jgi:hypothetical protein